MFKKYKKYLINSDNILNKNTDVSIIQDKLNISIPGQLKDMYSELGYGRLSIKSNNLNVKYNDYRILDVMEILDVYQKNDTYFLFDFSEYESFDICWNTQLIFFELTEDTFFSIGIEPNNYGQIFDNNVKLADSLVAFFEKLTFDPVFYEKYWNKF